MLGKKCSGSLHLHVYLQFIHFNEPFHIHIIAAWPEIIQQLLHKHTHTQRGDRSFEFGEMTVERELGEQACRTITCYKQKQ